MSVWNLRRFEVPHRTTSFLPFLLLVILCRFGTAVYRTEQVCTEMVRFSMCTVTGLQPHSPVCRYHIRTPSMTLALKGCSFECYKEVEAKSCCPGFWGPDCIECPEEASRPCSHNGVCSDGVGGNGTCSCKEGFAGTACEICASGRYGPKCSSVCTCVHGLCNAGLNGDGTCMCFSGYKGPNCNQEVPECAALSCPSNSRCIEEAATGQLACQCMPGYRKDSPNAQCLSINPCLQRICHAQATCIHTGPNQHMCACNEGYSGDGHVCMAIDPCQTNRGGCSADSTHCVYDEPGKVRGNWTRSGANKSVYNLLYLCLQTAACCSGFFGADCSPCPGGYTTPCSGHGKCLDGLSGNGTCVCDPNFGGSRCHYCSSLNKYGLNCDKTCLCINGQCDNRPNSDGSCKPDSCLPGFTGRFCERQTAACGTNVQFCHAHAVCDFSETPTRCVCKPGFNGDGITCVESDPCAPPLRGGCSVNAKCIKTGVGTHTCQCLSGWREDGDDCQPINNCDSPDNGGCHPNATCIYVGPGQSDCSCKSGYKGNGRDCEAINQCVTLSGGCHYLVSTQYSYYLTQLNQINRIQKLWSWFLSNTMLFLQSLDGKLIKSLFIHKCCAGFFGEHCEPCPGPKGQPCFGNGACSDGINGTGVCGCFQGFNGTACETCQSGKYGVHCDQGCKCKNGRCNEGLKGDGTCECDVGWRGILCDETLLLCCHVPCQHNHNLEALPSGLQCLCAAGFEGNGTFCQAKDPCAWDNGGCSLYAVCKRTRPGQRQCVCNSGYTGDGLVCVEVNPCLEGNGGCHVNADCVHVGPNKTSCACSEGYEGDGQTCNMIDLCRKKNGDCHKYARCNMTGPGVRTCTCMSYYIGDGVTCKGTVGKVSKIVSLLNHSKVVSLNQLFTLSLSFFYLQDDTYVFQDTGVVDLVQDAIHQPITIFLPSDAAMASLPQQQKDFLFNPQNQAQLQEYLKYHILPSQKVSLIHLDSPRTIQGSPLSFSCGGLDAIVSTECRIVQRHLIFREGIAYGIDCLLTPPSLGGRCDEQSTFEFICIGFLSLIFSEILSFQSQEVQRCDLPTMFVTRNSGCRSTCTVNFWQPKCCPGYYGRDCLVCPGGVGSPCNNRGKCDDGHLGNGTCTCNAGFGGVACELCNKGFYGPTCKACNCSEHGSCDDGRRGTGSCFCEAGWTGERCETPQAEVYQCSPACSPKAVCQQNNTCVCRPFYVGDGLTCTVVDMCQVWNGGCAKDAKCSQKGEQVSCTCPKGYTGDGYVCLPIDPCADGNNGGCHEHAICTLTAPGKRKCSCKDKYIGDGVTCDVKQLPISRCLQDNGLCHQDAKCTDLHFEDATLGVFHLRSDKGQYKLNYTAAQQACSAVGGTLATYMQLSYAQQVSEHTTH
uniref:Stabilin 2 n=1 Tax=Sphaeramia orbicularis TaxID=375764 RepID=A0A673BK44_9TELE